MRLDCYVCGSLASISASSYTLAVILSLISDNTMTIQRILQGSLLYSNFALIAQGYGNICITRYCTTPQATSELRIVIIIAEQIDKEYPGLLKTVTNSIAAIPSHIRTTRILGTHIPVGHIESQQLI